MSTLRTVFSDEADKFATRAEDRAQQLETWANNVIATNCKYARKSRGQFAHARALVMAQAITSLVETTTWRAREQ